jgi:FixJ family two-component response regulator
MKATHPVVAIVDDDPSVRRALRRLVASLSFAPADFPSGETFLESVEETRPHCALVDLHMPGLNGLEVLLQLRKRGLRIPTIIVTGNTQPDMERLCLEAGAAAYLLKPLDRDSVFAAVQAAALPG